MLLVSFLAPTEPVAERAFASMNVGDDPDFLYKMRQRMFAELDQSAEGKAQAIVAASIAILCLNAAGISHEIGSQINDSKLYRWAGNELPNDDPTAAEMRGRMLFTYGGASSAGLSMMPIFGRDGACTDEETMLVSRNILDYVSEAALGAVPREAQVPVYPSARLLKANRAGTLDTSRMYVVRNHARRDDIFAQMKRLDRAGQQVLYCAYGPEASALKSPRTFTFWYEKVPMSRKRLLETASNNPLALMGDLALIECPGTAGEASAFQIKALSAQLIEPDTTERWRCKILKHVGSEPDRSIFSSFGLSPGKSILVTFDVSKRYLAFEVDGGLKQEITQWDEAHFSETPPYDPRFVMHVQGSAQGFENVSQTYAIIMTRQTGEMRENLYAYSTRISSSKSALSFMDLTCKIL